MKVKEDMMHLNSQTLTTLFAPLALVFVACEAPEDAFRTALPDRDTLEVSFPTTQSQSQGLTATSRAALVGQPSDLYRHTYFASQDLNALGGFVIELVETIAGFPATEVTEDRAVWGPFSDVLDPNEYRLVVVQGTSTPMHYLWRIDGRAKGTENFDAIAWGAFEPAEVEEQGRGWFAVDFDRIAELDPTEDGQGRIRYAFLKNDDGVAVRAVYVGADNGQAVAAGYAYGRSASGEGYMGFALPADIHDGDATQSAAEDLLILTRWQADGAGRADVVATAGDLGADVAYGAQCWDSGYISTFEMFSVNGRFLVAAGDASTCALAEVDPESLPQGEDELANPYEGEMDSVE